MADDQIDLHNGDPYRTAYHFQPANNWMNDPCGPMIYKGIYHLFYQYYPHEPVWRFGTVWGHSTSTDLINWTAQPIALWPTNTYDIKGCWSGSATVHPDGEYAVILYTGGDEQGNQVQIIAVPKDPSDPYLREWVKETHNLIMVGSPTNKNIDALNFRDPSTAWQSPADGKWRVIVGTQQANTATGSAVLFTSDDHDLSTWWDTGHPLRSVQENGAIPRTIVLDKLGKQLVQWPITEVETLRQNEVTLPSQVIKGASGIEINQVTAAQVDVEITFKIPNLNDVEELDPSLNNPQELSKNMGATIEGTLGPFGLLALASKGLEEYTAVFFRIFKGPNKYEVLMCSDQSKSSLDSTTNKVNFGTFMDVDPITDELCLRILIDHSII